MPTETTHDTSGALAGTKIKKLKIDVTEDMIRESMPKDSSHCMIATAVKAAATNKRMRISKVLVDVQTIRFTDLDTKDTVYLPHPMGGSMGNTKV